MCRALATLARSEPEENKSCQPRHVGSRLEPRAGQLQVHAPEGPGNDAPIGGIKIGTGGGWFAARPAGPEEIYKICAESFRDEDRLRAMLYEARLGR